MDIAKLILGALTANPDIVTPHATAYANNAVDNSYTIDDIVSASTLEIINSETSVPVVYTAKNPANAGDHPAAAALRSVIRQMYDKAVAPFTSSSFLHIGATAREIRKYRSDGRHHFALHGAEAKDEGRNALLLDEIKGAIYEAHTKAEMLAGIAGRETAMSQATANARRKLQEHQRAMAEKLISGSLLSDSDFSLEKTLKTQIEQCRGVIKSFSSTYKNRKTAEKKKNGNVFGADTPATSLKKLLGPNVTANKFLERVKAFEICDMSDMAMFTTLFDDVMGLEGRVFSTSAFSTGHALSRSPLRGFDILCFEDVGYDFDRTKWLEYFHQTGATTGFVVGMFPLELQFDNLAPSRMYTIDKKVGGKVVMRFPQGFSSTYEHDFDTWSLLMRNSFIRGGASHNFDIHVETKSRVGPYALIELHKVAQNTEQSFVTEAPKNRRTVSILRPSSLVYVSVGGKKVVDYTKAKRFDFPEAQLDQLLSFFSTLDVKSQTLTNMLNFTRRAFEGISLVKGVEAKHWADFDQDLIPDLCSAVTMYVLTQLGDQNEIMSIFGNGSGLMKSQMADFPGWFRSLFGPFSLALEWLCTDIRRGDRLADFLIRRRVWTRDFSTPQPFWMDNSELYSRPLGPRTLFLDSAMFGESATPCPVCKSLTGKLGKQKVSCNFRPDSKYDVTFTEDECLALKVEFLKNASEQAGQLCETLGDAAKSLLVANHQHITRVEYIRGGPGVGKSYLIRTLYPGMATATIAVPLIELLADYPRTEIKTTHKLVKAGSKKILFVDEFSIFDGRVLRYMIARYKVDLVYVVGDTEQNKILPSHGQYIGLFFNMDEVSRHSLHQNFRTDSRYIVSRLNKVGSYAMHTSSPIPRLPIIKDISEFGNEVGDEHGDVMVMRFSDNAEKEYCPGAKSVASVQGKTCDVAKLILSKYDRALSTATGSFIVSISRQRTDLYIYADLKETKDWEFWSMLGYAKSERLSDDGETYIVEMTPTAEALAYMDAPQDLPTNVDLSKDLTRIRKVWSEVVNPDIVDRLSNTFVKTHYHYLRSFINDTDTFSLDELLLSFRVDADMDFFFDTFRDFGLHRRRDICETTKYYFDESTETWCSPTSDVAAQHAAIIYEDASDVHGQMVKKCFLRSLRAVGCDNATLVAAYKLCLSNPGGVSSVQAVDFFLEHADQKVAVWCTALGYSHPQLKTPACDKAIELVDGHWRVKVERAHILIAGSEKHIAEPKSIFLLAARHGWRLSKALYEAMPEIAESLETLLDAVSTKPRTALGKKMKLSLGAEICRERLANKEAKLDALSRMEDGARRPLVCYASRDADNAKPGLGNGIFVLNELAGQGITIDVLEGLAPKPFAIEAELLRAHVPLPAVYDRPLIIEHQLSLDNPSCENLGQVPHDSFICGPEHLPVSYTVKAHSTLNERAASFFSDLGATNGKVSPRIFQPTTKKNRISAKPAPKFAVSIGEGLHYDSRNTAQTLATMVKRYLQPSRSLRSVSGALLAKKIARHAAKLVLIPGRRLPEDMQEAVFRKHCADSHKRNYAGRAVAEGEHNARRINFTMKDIFKPAKTEIKEDKVGQGISASSAFLNFAFGGGFRVMTAAWQYALKDNTVLDNGYTEMEFAEIVGEQLDLLPGSPDTCVLDVEAMDSTQNWFTQEIEKEFWKQLGICEGFVDEYFTFRNDYPIYFQDIIKATVSSAKGSGLPDTLSGNSLIIMVMALWGVKRTGIFFMIVKGDDCAMWGYNLAYDEEAMLLIRKYSPFKFSIDINVPMEFCGNAIEGKFICPDLYRTLRKITGNRFKDYTHWAEYQKSLRTRISLIWQLGFTRVVQINAARCGVSEMRMMDVLYAIVSYSHIDREQFDSHFSKVNYPDPYHLS